LQGFKKACMVVSQQKIDFIRKYQIEIGATNLDIASGLAQKRTMQISLSDQRHHRHVGLACFAS
jgi:hypothetical protein